ncbi:MAG: glycosyltransferase family 4 protein [Bryobacteraceae bacterium]
MNLRLCFLCNEYPPGPHGGIGTMTQVLGRALQPHCAEVRVLGISRSPSTTTVREEDQGVQIWRLPRSTHKLSWIENRFELYRQAAYWARSGEIDLIEAPDYEGWIAGWPRLPVPVVARLHGTASYFAAEAGSHAPRLLFAIEKAAMRRADFWCSVSQYTAGKTARLFHLDSGPDAILYNPVEPAAAAHRPEGERVVFSGTLVAKKGVVPLMRAWNEVHRARPAAELHVYGKDGRTPEGGSMREYLTTLLDDGARPAVTFHGHVSREGLFEAISSARAAVFPSYAEAFAIAPLETMVRGCPTIYSTRGSGRELLEDGREGLLVDPDHPGEIAAGIVRLLTDDAFARSIGEAGARRVRDRFSTARLVEENLAFYEQCIRRFSSAAR